MNKRLRLTLAITTITLINVAFANTHAAMDSVDIIRLDALPNQLIFVWHITDSSTSLIMQMKQITQNGSCHISCTPNDTCNLFNEADKQNMAYKNFSSMWQDCRNFVWKSPYYSDSKSSSGMHYIPINFEQNAKVTLTHVTPALVIQNKPILPTINATI